MEFFEQTMRKTIWFHRKRKGEKFHSSVAFKCFPICFSIYFSFDTLENETLVMDSEKYKILQEKSKANEVDDSFRREMRTKMKRFVEGNDMNIPEFIEKAFHVNTMFACLLACSLADVLKWFIIRAIYSEHADEEIDKPARSFETLYTWIDV